MITDIRIRISGLLAPHVAKAIETEAKNSRALAASFMECAKNTDEVFFKNAAVEELKLAQELERVATRITIQLMKND